MNLKWSFCHLRVRMAGEARMLGVASVTRKKILMIFMCWQDCFIRFAQKIRMLRIEECLLESFSMCCFTWCTCVVGYPLRWWSLASDSIDTAASLLGICHIHISIWAYWYINYYMWLVCTWYTQDVLLFIHTFHSSTGTQYLFWIRSTLPQ